MTSAWNNSMPTWSSPQSSTAYPHQPPAAPPPPSSSTSAAATPPARPTSYEAARRATRALESRLDRKLSEYARLVSQVARAEYDASDLDFGRGSGGARRNGARARTAGGAWGDLEQAEAGKAGAGPGDAPAYEALEREVEGMLEQLSSQLQMLTSTLSDDTASPLASSSPSLAGDALGGARPTPTQLHAIQRHREVLADLSRDFSTSRANLRHALERRNLLGDVRGDIDAYKALHASDQDALLAERTRLDNSHAMIDRTLDQAYATRSEVHSQRLVLQRAGVALRSAVQRIPALNHVLRLVQRRRSRDAVVVGAVAGVCTVALVWSVLRR